MNKDYHYYIRSMARDMDLSGELPNIYSDEYKGALLHKMIENQKYCKSLEEIGLGKEVYPVFGNNGYQDETIFKLLIAYIGEEYDSEIKKVISEKIADEIFKNALNFYREEIEKDVRREYNSNYLSFGTFEQIPYSI